MAILQTAPSSRAEIEAQGPLSVSPEEVLTLTEEEWYARVYRGEDAAQLTFRAIAMGSLLGFLLAFTNLYIGLKTGWHLGVAITACILSFTIWSFMLKGGIAKTPMTILENNCMQSTASSAGYSTGSTLVSAFPALLMLSATADNPGGRHTPVWVVVLWTLAVAVLGVVLAIPMKRRMINQERLKFPSGTAAAVTLQSLYSHGAEAMVKARALLWAGSVGMLVPLLKDLAVVKTLAENGSIVRDTLLPGQSKIFDWMGSVSIGGTAFKPSDFTIKLDHGVALVAAGAIVGLRITFWMVVGGLILAFYVTPIALTAEWTSPTGELMRAASHPAKAWKEIGLWIGAPMLVSAGLLSFVLGFGTILRALGSMGSDKKVIDDALAERVARTEVPRSWFWVGSVAAGLPLIWLAWRVFDVPPHLGLVALLMTFVLGLVACRATGESDITPTGAMGKIMQLTYGVLMPQSVSANLMTAAITSGSAAASADLLNDLKSGYLLGANPRRQFIAQAMGVIAGTVASVLGYYLLVPDATVLTGIDGRDPAFAAPSAQQWKAVAEVFKLGIDNLHPMAQRCIFAGITAGIVLGLAERYAPARLKRFVPSSTGIGIGFILPFYYPLAMFLGAVLATVAEKVNAKWAERFVVPISSGLIAGESIIGVIVAGLNNFVLN
jgi:OPT family oligopeptide transporter